jgi:retron-type reverse transcriptase
VAHILWHQARGRTWVVDADIADYFNTVEHTRLLDLLAWLDDDRVLELIAAWLAVGATHPGCGIAQGSVLSPLLANIFLHPFDVAMITARLALVRYADDFVIMCAGRAEAEAALVRAANALAARNLALNGDKTTIVPFGPDFEFLGARFTN